MSSRLSLLAVLNAVFLLSALGCGDEGGGCGPVPEKKEEQSPSGGGPGNTGSTSRGGDIQISDKIGRVPKPYQRPASAHEPQKSTAPISRITKRRVDGVMDRVEVTCRIMAASPDGQCSGAANYAEIKKRCCPGGRVERCKTTMSGIVLVGRGCRVPGP